MNARLVFALAMMTTTFLPGCNSPTSSDDEQDLGGLDAEAGKNRFNAYSFQQGDLNPTGNPFDLAISGPGLFVLENQGRKVLFRRPAKFIYDAKGYFTLGNDQIRLQGIKVWNEINPYITLISALPRQHTEISEQLTDIQLPFQMRIPPKTTQKISITGNLPANTFAKGSIIYTQRFIHHAEKDDILTALASSTGGELGMRAGDVLTLAVNVSGITEWTTFTVQSNTTLNDLVLALQAFLRGASVGTGITTTVDIVTPSDDLFLRGALTIYGNTREINNLQITSDRPISSPRVTKSFSFPSLIPALTQKLEVTSDYLRAPAVATDLLWELFDTNGNFLGLDDGDEILVSGTIGGIPAINVSPLVYETGINATTLSQLMQRIKDNFKLPERDGTPANNHSVAINSAASDDNIPDGSIVIRGMPETQFALGSVVVTASNAHNVSPTPNNFNANMNSTTLRDATDSFVYEALASVYDSMGVTHTLRLTFTSSHQPNEWLWQAEIVGAEGEWTKPSGTFSFDSRGNLKTWLLNSAEHMLRQVNAANAMFPLSTLRIDLGGLTPYLTQYGMDPNPLYRYETPITLSQDGYAVGYLSTITVDGLGRIKGTFTNGYTRTLYLIPLADFPNKQGLRPVGANSFIESPESGSPAYFTGLNELSATLVTSHIEAPPQ